MMPLSDTEHRHAQTKQTVNETDYFRQQCSQVCVCVCVSRAGELQLGRLQVAQGHGRQERKHHPRGQHLLSKLPT
jgi:hypothetical protein